MPPERAVQQLTTPPNTLWVEANYTAADSVAALQKWTRPAAMPADSPELFAGMSKKSRVTAFRLLVPIGSLVHWLLDPATAAAFQTTGTVQLPLNQLKSRVVWVKTDADRQVLFSPFLVPEEVQRAQLVMLETKAGDWATECSRHVIHTASQRDLEVCKQFLKELALAMGATMSEFYVGWKQGRTPAPLAPYQVWNDWFMPCCIWVRLHKK